MAKVTKAFQFTQKAMRVIDTHGKKSISLVGELAISGTGTYENGLYDFTLKHVLFTPDNKGIYKTPTVDVIELFMYMGIDPKKDDRILYPTMAHLIFLFDSDKALQLSNILISEDMAGAIDFENVAYENQQS